MTWKETQLSILVNANIPPTTRPPTAPITPPSTPLPTAEKRTSVPEGVGPEATPMAAPMPAPMSAPLPAAGHPRLRVPRRSSACTISRRATPTLSPPSRRRTTSVAESARITTP